MGKNVGARRAVPVILAMASDLKRPNRRSIRLRNYDYSRAGAYFLTVCVRKRLCLFGDVVAGKMVLNEFGTIVRDEWLKTAEIRENIEMDSFVVMPNHVHGIVLIAGCAGTARRAPTLEQFANPVSGSLPTIIRSFKSAATRQINKKRNTPGHPVWQRNYYEHVIRNDDDLEKIREYILTNPYTWDTDIENPARARRAVPLQWGTR